jgi:L-iditol 2-dehydrogenase
VIIKTNGGDDMLEIFLNKPNDIEIRNAETLPPLKDNEVKVKLIYGGICGSDLRVFQGTIPYAAYPLRPGHELLGHIIEVGNNVGYELGTRVVIQPNSFCGQCKLCLSGRTNICREKKSLGVNINGGFSEEFIIPSKYVLPIPNDLSDEKAILIEPFAVIVHAFKKVQISEGTNVAIIGCGNEGMLAAVLARYLGAQVTAMDINPVKIDLVRSLGGIRVLHPDEVHNETFDIVIEAAGTSKAIEFGMKLVNPGGVLVMIGITQEANLPVAHVVRNEITLYGTIIYNIPDDFVQAIEYLRNTDFDTAPIVSKILPFTEYKQAYELALSGNYGKIILSFTNSSLS